MVKVPVAVATATTNEEAGQQQEINSSKTSDFINETKISAATCGVKVVVTAEEAVEEGRGGPEDIGQDVVRSEKSIYIVEGPGKIVTKSTFEGRKLRELSMEPEYSEGKKQKEESQIEVEENSLTQEENNSIKMATDESVALNSEDPSSVDSVLDSNSNVETEEGTEEHGEEVEQDADEEDSNHIEIPQEITKGHSEEPVVVVESSESLPPVPGDRDKAPVESTVMTKAPPLGAPLSVTTKGSSSNATQIPQMLPNTTVIAVVQPTSRTSNNSNYVRINANPVQQQQQVVNKATRESSHYVAVPAQRVLVTSAAPSSAGVPSSGGGQAQKTAVTAKPTQHHHPHHHNHHHHQQQQHHHNQSGTTTTARRVVSYAPGITIHHCQPGGGGGGTATVAAPQQTNTVTLAAQPVWPIVDAVFHFGPGFEPPSRPYCPTHEPQPQEHVVMFHVHPGVSVSFQIGGNQEIVRGPVTVPMVSQSGSPPIPMPVQVPPGHLMQQVVDENGTLRHVILSPAQTHQIHNQGGVQHHIHGHFYPTNGTASQYYSAIPTSAFATGPLPPPQHTAGPPPQAGFNAMTAQGGIPGGGGGGGAGGGGGGNGNTTYTLVQQAPPPPMHSQHSPSPPNASNSGGNQVAYHNKDERLQQIHKKLQKKLEKRDLNAATANGGASPRKGGSTTTTNNGTTVANGSEMHLHSTTQSTTIPVSMVVGNKRNQNNSGGNSHLHKQIAGLNQQQQLVSGGGVGNYQQQQQQHHSQQQQFQHHHHHHHHHHAQQQQLQQQQQQHNHHHLNNHTRIVLANNNATLPLPPAGRKMVSKSSAATGQKKRGGQNGTTANGNCGSSVGTSEDGEEGTSSVPEDEEYQLDVEDEVDGGMEAGEHHPGGMVIMSNGGECDGGGGDGTQVGPLSSAEEEMQHIKEQLSLVAGPKVSEILSRSALLQWVPPPNSETFQFDPQDLFYEILLSDSAKYAKYKSIFKGQSLSCRIQDLKPGIEYSVCLRVHYQSVQGLESPTTIFNTVPCAPDAPLPPKLLTRSKNTFQLRWNVTNDNGAHIQHYVLEYDCGRGMDFVEVCRTKGRQYSLTKLMPSTNYRFRLYAINEYGKSDYSKIETFQTACPPPSQPLPPTMPYASSSSLRLDWLRRNTDKEFVLQMATLNDNGHGYLPCYAGPDSHYECTNLPRATGFLFRLKATNESGASPWSPDVYYYTLPDPPGRPPKPQVKGKIHATHFRIRWDPPVDCGGAPIKLYELQISSGAAYEQVYVGPDTETQFMHLSPATTYQVRVLCEGPGGHSPFSEPCTVTTEPVTPCAPQRPQLLDLGVYSAVIRWAPPSDNGGSPVLDYEVELEGKLSFVQSQQSSSETMRTLVYRGKELCCDLKQLLPGEKYKLQVRAYNRIGAGAWSEVFAFSSNAAPPNTPKPPAVTVIDATRMVAKWTEPINNGSPVEKYILEMSSADQSPDAFNVVYSGRELSHELVDLRPFSRFYFKLCAVNAFGTSNYTDIVEVNTPPGPPDAPEIHELLVTEDSVTVRWTQPQTNGAEITCYCIMYHTASRGPSTKDCVMVNDAKPDAEGILEWTIGRLSAETPYKIRLRAENSVGHGEFSNFSKVTTLPRPPTPPTLECVAVAHNSLKLKWGEGKNVDFLYYYVDMSHSRSREYANVYSGNNFTCKVTKLAERTTYKFRIRAKADKAGLGPYSEDFLFQTTAALPASIKAPRVFYPTVTEDVATVTEEKEDVSNVNVEWQHSKNTFHDVVEYILQIRRLDASGQEYSQVYRGPETKHLVENLDCGVEYAMRVCPVRMMTSRKTTGSGSSKRSRDSRSSDSETTLEKGDSRSSSCSQRTTDGGESSRVTEETSDCDNVELMGQWSPVFNYVVPTQLQLAQQISQAEHAGGVHHHHHGGGGGTGSAGDHHHHHNHGHHPHNHIHHPHSHHPHHRSSHHHHQGGVQQAIATAGVMEGKSDSDSVSVGAGGVLGKLRSLYSSRHNMSDAEKAMISAVALMLVAIGVAIAFDCILATK